MSGAWLGTPRMRVGNSYRVIATPGEVAAMGEELRRCAERFDVADRLWREALTLRSTAVCNARQVGLTYDQIAEALGVTRQAVLRITRRAYTTF